MFDDQDGCEWVSFFWYRPTRVVPDQRPLNGCVCVLELEMASPGTSHVPIADQFSLLGTMHARRIQTDGYAVPLHQSLGCADPKNSAAAFAAEFLFQPPTPKKKFG